MARSGRNGTVVGIVISALLLAQIGLKAQTRPSLNPKPDIPPEMRNNYDKIINGYRQRSNQQDIPNAQIQNGIGATTFTESPSVYLFANPEKGKYVGARNEQGIDELPSMHDSWMGWWEVNRTEFLHPREPYSPKDDAEPVPSAVSAALLKGAISRNALVRSEAVLALGLVRYEGAFKILRELTRDSDDIVRMRAWAAIGLLNSSEAIGFLEVAPPVESQLDSTGWSLAVCLLDRTSFSDTIRKAIVRQLNEARSAEAQRLALRALRADPGNADRKAAFLKAAAESRHAMVILEALSGLAEMQDETWFQDLAISANGDSAARSRAPRKFGLSVPQAALVLQAYDHAPDALKDLTRRTIGDLRYQQGPILVQPTMDDLQRMLVVGRIGEADGLDRLLGSLDITTRPQVPITIADGRPSTLEKDLQGNAHAPNSQLEARRQLMPTRGYGAIALGLYERRHGGAIPALQEPQINSQQQRLGSPADALIDRFQISSDAVELRSACALGLALTGSPQHAARVKAALRNLQLGEEPVAGYGLLALGMMGDSETLDLASQCLGQPKDSIDINALKVSRPSIAYREVVWRRAAIQGLAAFGDARAIPLLMGQWGQNDAVSLEVARAIGWCAPKGKQPDIHAGVFGDQMAQLVTDPRSPPLSALAAASLGLLHEKGGSDRLGQRLNRQSSYWRGTILATGPARRTLTFNPQTRGDSLEPQQQIMALGNPYFYLAAP